MLVDDLPLARYGKAAFRHQVGAIMQDDLLYAGSIAGGLGLGTAAVLAYEGVAAVVGVAGAVVGAASSSGAAAGGGGHHPRTGGVKKKK